MLWEKVLQNDVKCSLVMRKRLPLREWKYEMMVRPFSNTWDCEIFPESPFVSGA